MKTTSTRLRALLHIPKVRPWAVLCRLKLRRKAAK